MGQVLRGTFLVIALLLMAAAFYVRFVFGPQVDADMNPVVPNGIKPVSAEAVALHDELCVVDLHADTLLWARDPQQRQTRGHTDLPRLREGRVAVQVFSAVTKTPADMNYDQNTGGSDNITWLAMGQWWPVDTWGLLGEPAIFERARYQARRLQRVERKDDQFTILRTKNDLAGLLQRRAGDKAALGGILAIEGAHALEGELENIDRLYDEGYRMMGVHHFFDNELGGSLHGVSEAGLSEFGKAAIKRMDEKGIMIDVAHSSHQVVRDVMALTDRPLIVSHTGIYSACAAKRNIPDELMAEIAAGGGLIGIGYWADVTCDDSPDGIARVIIHAADKFGVDHVALGSDYDGTVQVAFDTSQLALITDALMRQGMAEEDIRKVMGENALRLFAEQLPE